MSDSQMKAALNIASWQTDKIKYIKPRINEGGKGKSVGIISTQLNSKLILSTPPMATFGIADFIDPKTGVSDGKYTICLRFPGEEGSEEALQFLQKFKAFEDQILNDAVLHSELWWGESRSRELVKAIYSPSIKYTKLPGTTRPDPSKNPTMRARLYTSMQTGKWDIEVYDTKREILFPDESNEEAHPKDYVPSGSQVACLLQCGGLWFTGAGWGMTWRCIQVVVKPPQNFMLVGAKRCLVDTTSFGDEPAAAADQTNKRRANDEVCGVLVNDSDDDDDHPAIAAVPVVAAPAPAPAEEAAPAQPIATVDAAPPAQEESASPVVEAKKKKTVVVKSKTAAVVATK